MIFCRFKSGTWIYNFLSLSATGDVLCADIHIIW